MNGKAVVEDAYLYSEETNLTVLKTSLFFTGDGFTAYDCKGELVFRVDTYGPDSRDLGELVLMDATGRCLLTVRRKRPSLHNRWEGFLGEREEGQKPIFSVRRSSIIGRSSVTVEVYSNPMEEYQIEGSFAQRNCTFFNADKVSVAEIRRKVAKMYVNCSSYLNRDDDDDSASDEFPKILSRNPNQLRATSVFNPRRPVVDYSESEDEGQAQWSNHNKPPHSTNDISSLLRMMMMLNLRQGAGAGAGRTSQLILSQNRRPIVDYSDTDEEEISAHYRQIKHFSHPHSLNKYDVERDNEINCKVCGLQILGSAYGCQRCQFYLHVSCFDLPQKIQHDSHPAHPLTLRNLSYYKNCGKSCDACCEDIRRSFLYCCDPCNFDLHVTCATLYSIARRNDSPKDTLRLYYSFPVSDNNQMHWIARCNVCNKKVSKEGWLYYSKDTGYIAHIKCAKGAKVGVSWIKERLNMLKVK